jgi:hypothetical protein
MDGEELEASPGFLVAGCSASFSHSRKGKCGAGCGGCSRSIQELPKRCCPFDLI